MLDPAFIRDNLEVVRAGLRSRGMDPDKALEEIATLEAPTLIVQGTTDIQVSVEDAELLAAAKPNATLALIEDMMHQLKHATADTASQQQAYTDASLPIVPEVIDRSVDLVLQQ